MDNSTLSKWYQNLDDKSEDAWLSLLHNFIQQSLNLGSAHLQILLTVCQRFAMVRISDSSSGWK